MSRFVTDLKLAFLGKLSVESAAVDAEPTVPAEVVPPTDPVETPTVPDCVEAITDEVALDIRDERIELADNLELVEELGDDLRDLESSVKVADSVADAVQAVETTPAQAAEAFVDIANVTISNANDLLDTSIPPLSVEIDTGEVSEVSVESVTGWFGSACKAFSAAAGSFFGRIGLAISRLNDSSKGLIKRSTRVRGMLSNRKGKGGEPIKLSSGVLRQLVINDGYSGTLAGDITTFAKTVIALSDIVEQYHTRLAALIKTQIFDAISKNVGRSIINGITVDDLLQEMKKILDSQPKNLLGNVVYDFQEHRYNKILTAKLASTATDASVLVKHLDQITSLTNEEILMVLDALDEVVVRQLKTLELITSSTKTSFAAVKSVIEKLNHTTDNDDDDDKAYLDPSIDVVELLRIENYMVSELGRVCDRLVDYQRDLIDRVDSILTLVEESVLQD